MSKQDMAGGPELSSSGTPIIGTKIPGYENYIAYTDGTISRNGRKLRHRTKRTGYQEVVLSVDGKPKSLSVHRLICLAFRGIPDGYVVNHKDGDKTNNCLSNLEAITPEQNFEHARKYTVRRGEQVNTAKVSREAVELIRELSVTHTTSDLMHLFPLCRSSINRIKSRKAWANP